MKDGGALKAQGDAEFLSAYDGPALRVMEVCGTHTAAIFKSGIRSFLSPKIRLVSGPGCPVCVTEPSYIDRCIETAMAPGCELVCFGDLMRIPGAGRTLSDAKGAGGRVRMVWSPFDAILLAQREPETTFVVAAIGFETTAPAFALLIEEAVARGVHNLKLVTALKSALAAIDWICAAGEAVDAFLCPGHVSVVTGADAYIPLAESYGKPFVVAGFEGEHLLAAIRAAVEDASRGCGGVRNFYTEAVSAEGNKRAREATGRYFELGDADWRGLGTVAASGYFLREEFRSYEAMAAGGTAGDGSLVVLGSSGAPGDGSPRALGSQGDGSPGDGSPGAQGSLGDGSPGAPGAPGDGSPGAQSSPEAGAQGSPRAPGAPGSPEVPGDGSLGSPGDGLQAQCRCGDVIMGRIDPNECPLFGTACTPSYPVGPCMISSEGACGHWYRNGS